MRYFLRPVNISIYLNALKADKVIVTLKGGTDPNRLDILSAVSVDPDILPRQVNLGKIDVFDKWFIEIFVNTYSTFGESVARTGPKTFFVGGIPPKLRMAYMSASPHTIFGEKPSEFGTPKLSVSPHTIFGEKPAITSATLKISEKTIFGEKPSITSAKLIRK